MTSPALVITHADQVERMHDTGAIFALRLDACEPEQRQALLDHHGRVLQLLRKRGHRVRAGIVHDDDEGELATLRIVTQQRAGLTWPPLT